jgi:Mce-associated membrane protein
MIARVLVVLAVLAVAAAGFTGWRWWSSSDSAAADLASQRDNVLAVGERQLVELNTVDFQTLDADFDRWRDAATGPLLERLLRNRESDRQTTLTAKTVAKARVVAAAVTNLNTYNGTANVIAAVEITLSQNGTQQPAKVSRMDVDLARTDAGWKVNALEVVST